MTSGPIVKRLFLSWSHDDESAKEALVTLLRINLRILRDVELTWWEDSHLLVGDEWRRELLARLDRCDFGVLLLSPRYFGNDFIVNEELPHFAGPRRIKGALPVWLERVPLAGRRELGGVQDLQIFTPSAGPRHFIETSGAGRRRFVQELATAIRDRVLADSSDPAPC